MPPAAWPAAASPEPAPQAAAPRLFPRRRRPQNGETMNVHDFGDGLDKTYYYHADTGEWVNPLTGGTYVAANYAASAQAQAETARKPPRERKRMQKPWQTGRPSS